MKDKKNYSHKFNEHIWKVLLVDDDDEVHKITKLILENIRFEDKSVEFLSAYSAAGARKILEENNDIAVIFLDVVMESDHAGLELVKFIREEIADKFTRIILRTGQAGLAPENSVIVEYDINDYKEKIDLTSQKLHTTLIAALRSYRDIYKIHEQQDKLKYQAKDLKETLVHLQLEILERKRLETQANLEKRKLKKDLKKLKANQHEIVEGFFKILEEKADLKNQVISSFLKLNHDLHSIIKTHKKEESSKISEALESFFTDFNSEPEFLEILQKKKYQDYFLAYPALLSFFSKFLGKLADFFTQNREEVKVSLVEQPNSPFLLQAQISFPSNQRFEHIFGTDSYYDQYGLEENLARFLFNEIIANLNEYSKRMQVRIREENPIKIDFLFNQK